MVYFIYLSSFYLKSNIFVLVVILASVNVFYVWFGGLFLSKIRKVIDKFSQKKQTIAANMINNYSKKNKQIMDDYLVYKKWFKYYFLFILSVSLFYIVEYFLFKTINGMCYDRVEMISQVDTEDACLQTIYYYAFVTLHTLNTIFLTAYFIISIFLLLKTFETEKIISNINDIEEDQVFD